MKVLCLSVRQSFLKIPKKGSKVRLVDILKSLQITSLCMSPKLPQVIFKYETNGLTFQAYFLRYSSLVDTRLTIKLIGFGIEVKCSPSTAFE